MDSCVFPPASSALSDSARSGRTRSTTASSLGKRKASAVLSNASSSPDCVDEPRQKQIKVSDEPTSRTGLPQDPGEPYIIVRKNNYLKKAKSFIVFKAYCPQVQRLLEKNKISHGIRYELARLVSTDKIDYCDITEKKVEALRGSNQEAAGKIPALFMNKSRGASTDSAFARELAAHVSSGLYLNGAFFSCVFVVAMGGT